MLHAILSVSAYNLQCRHASQNQEAVARKWAEIGSKYRMQALDFLKTSAGDPLVATTNSEDKELLAAMLCMVTIDVVSGDTRTCGIHLNGCESLIKARKRAGVKISSKTEALHRIFFYLRVMQDATELTCNAFQSPDHERGERGRAGPDDFETYLEPCEQLADEGFDSASYELIYSLPQSLLVLVHKTCKLLQRMNRADAVTFQRLLMPACDQLEEEILDWPVEEEVAKLGGARMDKGNCVILQHHMRAFHNAAIIFFCRNIRFMDRRHLQQYVKAVIHHLDEIEKIKEKEMINAGPLLWPAFVAGEQAIDSSTRAQLVGWFNRIERHGVATAKLTRASLEETWERAARNHSQVPISVLHTQLMLT
ncbi:arginine metabolism regulation protein II [Neofusicoccum ribis]|uniref:Arginine metabolism regulation protein II n=1 Tax=Neofusicoccum ribis TaxID=45134 RepID=A0ABR3SGG8_9PEZI